MTILFYKRSNLTFALIKSLNLELEVFLDNEDDKLVGARDVSLSSDFFKMKKMLYLLESLLCSLVCPKISGITLWGQLFFDITFYLLVELYKLFELFARLNSNKPFLLKLKAIHVVCRYYIFCIEELYRWVVCLEFGNWHRKSCLIILMCFKLWLETIIGTISLYFNIIS